MLLSNLKCAFASHLRTHTLAPVEEINYELRFTQWVKRIRLIHENTIFNANDIVVANILPAHTFALMVCSVDTSSWSWGEQTNNSWTFNSTSVMVINNFWPLVHHTIYSVLSVAFGIDECLRILISTDVNFNLRESDFISRISRLAQYPMPILIHVHRKDRIYVRIRTCKSICCGAAVPIKGIFMK